MTEGFAGAVFDVDGVLTDGSLTYDANGEITKTFYVLDGLGIQLLNRTGVQLSVFELFTARAYAREVRLRAMWEPAQSEHPIAGEFGADPYALLQSSSARPTAR